MLILKRHAEVRCTSFNKLALVSYCGVVAYLNTNFIILDSIVDENFMQGPSVRRSFITMRNGISDVENMSQLR